MNNHLARVIIDNLDICGIKLDKTYETLIAQLVKCEMNFMEQVKILCNDEKYLPKKATANAGAYDCKVREIAETPDGMVICKLGFKTAIPKGYRGILVARSSITNTGWVLANGHGVIDADFRDEWQARFRQINWDDFPYKVGDRVCQVYFEREDSIGFVLIDDLDKTDRIGGFGSTGNE